MANNVYILPFLASMSQINWFVIHGYYGDFFFCSQGICNLSQVNCVVNIKAEVMMKYMY